MSFALIFMNITKLKEKYGNEQVYVVPYVETGKIADGFKYDDKIDILSLERNGKFIYRYDAEYNEAFCQLIPYIIVVNEERDKIFVSRRIAGDERLTGSLSFFGGHINPCDSAELSVIEGAAKRELAEEVDFVPAKDTKYKVIGTVRETYSKTKEHLGIVYVVNVKDAKIREKDILEGVWMDYDWLIKDYGRFEGWAKAIIEKMFIEKRKGNKDFILKGGRPDEHN